MANVLNVGCKDIRGYCHKTDTRKVQGLLELDRETEGEQVQSRNAHC